MASLRVAVGDRLDVGRNLTEVKTLDGHTFQVGDLTIPYADHAATPATIANLQAKGYHKDGENTWITNEIDR